MKIVLKVPGYTTITFSSYENLNLIWEVMENYRNVEIIPIYDENEEIIKNNTTITETEVKENIQNIDNITNDAKLSYYVPKSVTFTHRFQDRINKEITDILNSVYPNYFNIDSINFEDIENDNENMKMIVSIKANSDEAIDKLKYLDSNVEFIIKDIVDYYI